MWLSVVENHAGTFRPGTNLITDSNSATRIRLWDDQAEVVAQHAFVWPAMFRNVFSRRQNRKHSGLHAGNESHQTGCLGTFSAVGFSSVTISEEEKSLPLPAFRQCFLFLGNVLEVWYLAAVL